MLFHTQQDHCCLPSCSRAAFSWAASSSFSVSNLLLLSWASPQLLQQQGLVTLRLAQLLLKLQVFALRGLESADTQASSAGQVDMLPRRVAAVTTFQTPLATRRLPREDTELRSCS